MVLTLSSEISVIPLKLSRHQSILNAISIVSRILSKASTPLSESIFGFKKGLFAHIAWLFVRLLELR